MTHKFKNLLTKQTTKNRILIVSGVLTLVITITITLITALSHKPTSNPHLNQTPKSSLFLFSTQNDIYQSNLGTKDTNQPKVTMQIKNSDAQLDFQLANTSGTYKKPKQINQDTLLFKDVQEGIDILYQTQPTGIKEEIILNQPTDQNTFIFDLNFQNALPQRILNNVYAPIFYDQNGNYLFHFEKPFAYDSTGNRTDAVDLQIIHDLNSNSYKAYLTVPTDWLNSPDRVYPIHIDPTTSHDSSSAFASGDLNRLKDLGSGASPELTTYYQPMASDEHTIGLWHMDEGSDDTCSGGEDACDSSGNGHHGTFTGSAAFSSSSLIGDYATTYTADTDYISVADSNQFTLSEDYTIEAWINPDDIGDDYKAIAGTHNGAGFIFALWNDSIQQLSFWTSTFGWINSGVEIKEDGQWKHVAYTRRGTVGKFYLNGKLVFTSNSATAGGNGGALHIGAGGTSWTTQRFDGLIDDVRISDVARSDEEIRLNAQRRPYSVFNSDIIDLGAASITSLDLLSWNTFNTATTSGETATPSAAYNRIAQWNFNETSGTTANNDAEGTSCNGTPSDCDLSLSNFSDTTSQDAALTSGWTSDNLRWGAGALMFDGSDDQASSSISPSQSADVTLETWVKINTRPTSAIYFADLAQASAVGLRLSVNTSGQISVPGSGGPSSAITSSQRFDDGYWHHVVTTRSGSTYYLYVDGTLIGSASGTTPTYTQIFFGSAQDGSGDARVVLDSPKLYSIPLSQDEVIANYTASQIQFQTRTGATSDPNDGTWESWTPTANETSFESFDNNISVATPSAQSFNWQKTNNRATAYTVDDPGTDGRIGLGGNGFSDDVHVTGMRVLQEDGLYKAWYTGYDGTNYRAFYAVSEDGLTWNKYNNYTTITCDTKCSPQSGNGIIPLGSNTTGDDTHVLAGTVINDGGTYKMWYSGSDGTNYRIYHATSSDGLTWTKYDNSIESASNTTGTNGRIPLGTSGTGDDVYAIHPSVIKDGSTYKMWYTGYDGATYQVLYATSSDGLTWTKYDNSIESASNTTGTNGRIPPGVGGTGDDVGPYAVAVLLDGSTYRALYTAWDGAAGRIYTATSSDGLTWTKSDNSVPSTSNSSSTNGRIPLGTSGTGDDLYTETFSLILDGSTYKTWYSGHDGSDYRVFLATSSDADTWTKTNNTSEAGNYNFWGRDGRLGLGNTGTGDDAHIQFPATIKDSNIGDYKMWYGASDGTNYRIFMATSSAGLNWSKVNNTATGTCDGACGGGGRLGLGTNTTGDDAHVYALDVLQEGTTYKMWYLGNDGASQRIYYATSTDEGKTWTKYNNAVPSNSDTTSTDGRLPIGTNGRGDDVLLSNSAIINDGGTYKMWYSGYDGATWRIYYATSADGLTWSKLDNTTASNCDLVCEGNGKMGLGSSGWGDDVHVFVGDVVKINDAYYMFYNGHDGTNWRGFWATSPDGLTWTKHYNGLLANANTSTSRGRIPLGGAGFGDDDQTVTASMINDTDAIRLWYSASDGTNYKIFQATMTPFTPSPLVKSTNTTQKTQGSASLELDSYDPSNHPNLIGYWPLDETNGDNAGDDIFDASSNNLDGEIVGTNLATGIVNGYKGKARTFNGSDDAITIDDTSANATEEYKGLTFHAWVKPDASIGNQDIIANKENAFEFGWGTSNQYISAIYTNSTTWAWTAGTGANTLMPEQWTHVATTWDGVNIREYINGVLMRTTAHAGAYVLDGANEIWIGGRSAFSTYWQGEIDEVVLLKEALATDDIQQIYQSGRDFHINKPITSTDLTSDNKLKLDIAADRPGTYLQSSFSESGATHPLTDSNTVGYWQMEEVSGEAYFLNDSSGNGNQLFVTGATFTDGKIGKARHLDGSDDVLYLKDLIQEHTGTGNFTIEAWVNPTSLSSNQATYGAGIFRSITDTNGAIGDMALTVDNDGSIKFYNWRSTGSDADGIAITADGLVKTHQWTHIAASWDGSNNHIYVNGQEVPITGTLATATGWVAGATIGRQYTSAGYYFNGHIDEVRVSDTARSASEIRQAFEYGTRVHPITIDFAAALDSGNLIADSNDLSFTIDSTTFGAFQAGENIYPGETIIVKETVDDTTYIAQGIVNAITASTGATTVDEWDASSTFPSSGFTANASVFKWQTEYIDTRNILSSGQNAVTNLTLSFTDNDFGRTVWIDNLQRVGDYMHDPSGNAIGSSNDRYFQYRAITTSSDTNTSSSFTKVSLDFTGNQSPVTPSLDSPSDTATNQSVLTTFQTTSTDTNSDYLQYKIDICENLAMDSNCNTYDQTSSQTGWSGQDAQSSTAYASGTQATYTLQSALSANTTYYWRSYAIDPAGSNTFSDPQGTPYSFTTTNAPSEPTNLETEGQTNPVNTSTTPYFTAIFDDTNTSDLANYYQIEVNTNNTFTGTVMWDSGQTTITPFPENTRSSNIHYGGDILNPGVTYYWRIKFWDDKGAEGAYNSTAASFTTAVPLINVCTLTKASDNSQITINWNDPYDSEDNFEIERNVNSGGFSSLTSPAADSTSYADSTVSNGNTYQYRVRAEEGSNYSDWCTTSTLSLESGNFNFEGLNLEGLNLN